LVNPLHPPLPKAIAAKVRKRIPKKEFPPEAAIAVQMPIKQIKLVSLGFNTSI
jgi:hypothetical protein